jgi:hypothetical protein
MEAALVAWPEFGVHFQLWNGMNSSSCRTGHITARNSHPSSLRKQWMDCASPCCCLRLSWPNVAAQSAVLASRVITWLAKSATTVLQCGGGGADN